MKDNIQKILSYLDNQEKTRDELLDISNRARRKSSSAISALHRGDDEEAVEKLQKIQEDIKKINRILTKEPKFSDHGAVITAHREFAEATIFKEIKDEKKVPDPDNLAVLYPAYAQAMAEAVGELRRHFLNLLRKDETEKAQKIHDKMEKIFDLLEQFDYPDSILPGMKHRKDMVRKVLEKTRADITRAIREKKLEKALKRTEKGLK